MDTAKRFEDLEVWKEARALAKKIFCYQMRGSAGAIMDNIAEGFDWKSI